MRSQKRVFDHWCAFGKKGREDHEKNRGDQDPFCNAEKHAADPVNPPQKGNVHQVFDDDPKDADTDKYTAEQQHESQNLGIGGITDPHAQRPCDIQVVGVSGIEATQNSDDGGYFFNKPSEKASDQAITQYDDNDHVKWIHQILSQRKDQIVNMMDLKIIKKIAVLSVSS